MCSLSLLSLPANGYAQEKSSCLQSIFQHTSRTSSCSPCCGNLRRRGASNNHGVRFMMGHARQNTKSTYGRERLTCHFTRTIENRRMCVQPCHVRKACSRHASSHQAVGLACTAIHSRVLHGPNAGRLAPMLNCRLAMKGDLSLFPVHGC